MRRFLHYYYFINLLVVCSYFLARPHFDKSKFEVSGFWNLGLDRVSSYWFRCFLPRVLFVSFRFCCNSRRCKSLCVVDLFCFIDFANVAQVWKLFSSFPCEFFVFFCVSRWFYSRFLYIFQGCNYRNNLLCESSPHAVVHRSLHWSVWCEPPHFSPFVKGWRVVRCDCLVLFWKIALFSLDLANLRCRFFCFVTVFLWSVSCVCLLFFFDSVSSGLPPFLSDFFLSFSVLFFTVSPPVASSYFIALLDPLSFAAQVETGSDYKRDEDQEKDQEEGKAEHDEEESLQKDMKGTTIEGKLTTLPTASSSSPSFSSSSPSSSSPSTPKIKTRTRKLQKAKQRHSTRGNCSEEEQCEDMYLQEWMNTVYCVEFFTSWSSACASFSHIFAELANQ